MTMTKYGSSLGEQKARQPHANGGAMDRVTRIHFKIGGETKPHLESWPGERITAVYYWGDQIVYQQTAPGALALGLLSVWDPDFEGVIEFEDVEITADWPVNFGRARKLESRALKALEQAP